MADERPIYGLLYQSHDLFDGKEQRSQTVVVSPHTTFARTSDRWILFSKTARIEQIEMRSNINSVEKLWFLWLRFDGTERQRQVLSMLTDKATPKILSLAPNAP